MNIHELSTFNLNDAIKFHNRLNPRLWDENEQLKPEVREKLLEIARDFQEFLGISDLEVEDITISGSNAAYSYTPHSDIDLHLVVKKPELRNDVYTELFNAKKYQYNDQHNIRVRGADVELYVQPADEPHVSLGIYSVLNDKWIQVPRRKRAAVEHSEVKLKYEDLKARIESAIASGDLDRMNAVSKKIKEMRQAGLDAHGEFGPENLAFKMLRTQGVIGDLFDARNAAKDRLLSLKEREKQKQKVRYGFTEEGSTPDGVSPTTCMFLNEEDAEGILQTFITDTAKKLGIKSMPKLVFHKDDGWSTNEHSFGMYQPETHTLHVSLDDRHILDILRTTAHELAHCRQHEIEPLPMDAGNTGSDWENEAHAVAGIIMRDFADEHPEYFDMESVDSAEAIDEGLKGRAAAAALAACIASGCATNMSGGKMIASAADVARTVNTAKKINSTNVAAEVHQEIVNLFRALGGDANAKNISRVYSLLKEASGYIPTKAQAKDPRFKTALTVDVHPGQTGKEANKMALKTDAQGRPGLLIKDLANQLREFTETGKYTKGHGYGYTPKTQEPGGVEDDLGNQEATGPEFPPQMPQGTTKIDVSDLTDWYRLGMDISDMDDADAEDYNQGPPQTVIVFPSDAAEQDYLKHFNRLGLKTHDIDPGGEHIQQLTELADSPYPFQIVQHGAEKSTFGFDTDADSEYIIKIVPFVEGQAFQNNALDVSFALMQDGRYVDTATGQAGHDALRVFGTVVEAIKQTIAKRTEQGLNIEYIQFKSVSKEPRRVALYQRFAKNIGRYMPGWEFWKNWNDDGISTSIVKRSNNKSSVEQELDEDWRNWVSGLGAASMIAGGGSAAYDAYKHQTQPAQPAQVQQVPAPQAKIQAPVAAPATQQTVAQAQSLLATKGAQILQKAAKAAGLKGSELAQFMAQCAHETANFTTLEEFGDRNYFKKYDIKFNPAKAKELGNLRPGDGERYKGRGFIQLTGRDNYKRAGEALGLPLEQKPELVERPDVAAKVALWFWQNRVQPKVDNFSNTTQATKPINPGLKGLQDRHNKFTGMKVAMAKPTTLVKTAAQVPAAKVAAKPVKTTKISKVATKPTKGKKV